MTLTNAHTHLELGWLAEFCPDETGRDYLSWSMAVGAERRRMAGMACFVETRYRQAVDAGIEALLEAGTTHIGDVSASGSSIHPLIESGLQGVVYVEMTGMYAEQADRAVAMARYVINEARPKERNGMRVGLCLDSLLSVHPALWRKGIAYAREENLPLSIHVAESQAEYDWAMADRGPLAEMYRDMGMSVSSPRMSPVAFLEDLGALELQPLLIHANHVDADDIERIKSSGSPVVYCPRSSQRLHEDQFPLADYLAAGVTVHLGTESLASSPSLDVDEEVAAAQARHGDVNDAVIAVLAAKGLD